MKDRELKGRSKSIDLLKGIAALLVCYQHACGTYGMAEYILAFSRVAVPLFVMITGYFYCSTVKKHQELVQIKKFVRIAIEMVLLYFLIDSAGHLLTGNIFEYWHKSFTLDNVIRFLIFNDPIHADHSWYMWAVIYVLILAWKVPSLWNNKNIRNVVIALTLFGLPFFSKYIYFINHDIILEPCLYRNFLIPIVAYFFLGILCWEKRKLIVEIGTKKWGALVVLSLLFICIEKFVLSAYQVDRSSGSYFFTMLLAISMFGMSLCFCSNNKILDVVAHFGRKYSLTFYVIHPLFTRIEFKIFDMQTSQQYLGYFFVVICSLVISILVVNVKEKKLRVLCRKIKNI